MRREQCLAPVLFVLSLTLRDTSGFSPYNVGMVDASMAYVEVFKSRLSEDTYYLVADPALNNSAELACAQATGAAWRFKHFFTTAQHDEYRAIVLKSILDFLNLSETTLKDLSFPVGWKQCQLVSEELVPEMLFDLNTLVANIIVHVDWLRGLLESGSFQAGYDKVKGIKSTCKGYTFYESLEEHLVRGCENAAAEPQSSTETRCLQLLVARSTNYSKDAMEKFKRALGKYVFIMIHVKTFCLTFTQAATASGDDAALNATKRFLYDLRAGMQLVDKLPMNNTGPWTCEDTVLPQFSTAPPTPQPTTASPNAPQNESVVRGVAERVVKEFKPKLDAKGWSDRDDFHKQIVNKTVDQLKNISSHYVFNAVAFLPFDRDDQKCIYREAAFVSAGYRNLNFFVRYVKKGEERAIETATKDIKGTKSAILDQVFGKGDGNLCDRLKSAIGDNDGKFGGILAVKCGYKFVWYQLAYEYFHAAASSAKGETAWETGSGGWDAKCGQIFFFT